MGSTSDWEVMAAAAETLEAFGIPYEKRVVSAHRTPDLLVEYAKTARGRGIGKKLYRALFAIGQLQNVKSIYGIVTSPNERSEAMHLAMGFTRVSTLKNVGYKDGWRDVSWFCKQIGAYAEPFTPFRPIGQLDPAQLEAALRESEK